MNDQDEMIKTPPHGVDVGRTQTLQVAGATQMGVSVECPVCRASNLPSETYCCECGFLLSEKPEEEGAAPQTPQVSLKDTRTGQVLQLWPGDYTVGRENADVLLSDGSVSRQHARILVRADGLAVTDAGSTNGTMVAGQKAVADQALEAHDGDEIRFGNCVMTVQIAAPAAGEPAEGEETAAAETASAEVSAQAAGESAPADEAASGETPEPEAPVEQAAPVADVSGADAWLEGTPDASVKHVITAEGVAIGRRAANDIIISNPYISGHHAVISCSGGGFAVTDVGSTNGTFLNGSKLAPDAPTALKDGDELAFGPLKFVFRLPEKSQPEASQ